MRGYARIRLIFDRSIDFAFERLSPGLAKHIIELRFQKSWATLYKRNFDKVPEYWRKYRFLDEIEEIVRFRDSVVLDVGCGISTFLNHIEAKEKYGVDPLAKKYKMLFKYSDDVKIEEGTGEDLPFPEESFDVVICSNVLDHTVNPSKTIDEIHRVLKPEGKLVLTLEIFGCKRTKRNRAHPHAITLAKLELLLRNFKVMFHKESPWIGYRAYIESNQNDTRRRITGNSEHILVCAKK